MADLSDLYAPLIREHGGNPRNLGALAGATHRARGDNPLCGDTVELRLCCDGTTILEARFDGRSCALCTASASLLTEAVRGKSIIATVELRERLEELVSTDGGASTESLGELAVLTAVRAFPSRRRCVLLPWRALGAALAGETGTVTTE